MVYPPSSLHLSLLISALALKTRALPPPISTLVSQVIVQSLPSASPILQPSPTPSVPSPVSQVVDTAPGSSTIYQQNPIPSSSTLTQQPSPSATLPIETPLADTTGIPISDTAGIPLNGTTAVPVPENYGNTSLRIMPLGDSITAGFRSSDSNGYRLDLHNMLCPSGCPPLFVGTMINGTNNPDNKHEGWGGHTINRVLLRLRDDNALASAPNVILLHIGTNDLSITSTSTGAPDEPYAGAAQRLGVMLDYIWCHLPDTVILVAQIMRIPDLQQRVDEYNAQIPAVVQARRDKGFKVTLVDQTSVGDLSQGTDGSGHAIIKHVEMDDGNHPSDLGYNKMAQNWFSAIQAIPPAWIVPGAASVSPSSATCVWPLSDSCTLQNSIISTCAASSAAV